MDFRGDARGPALGSERLGMDMLRTLYGVITRVHSSPDLQETLDAIAHGVLEATCFGVVVVNLVLPNGDLQAVSVVGDESATAALLGRIEPASLWAEVLEKAQRIGGLSYIAHDDPPLGDEMLAWIPDTTAIDAPDMWHPLDTLFAPLMGSDGALVGVLSVDLPEGGKRPGADQYEVLELFAAHAALAIQNAHHYVTQQQVVLLEARQRLAEDLHDLVVQRLYAAGMEVSLALRMSQSEQQTAHLNSVLSGIDAAVEELRSSIYALNQNVSPEEIHTALARIVTLATKTLRFRPALTVEGDFSSVPSETAADLIAVVNEALSNVAKHAEATAVGVEVAISPQEIAVTVTDNGRGMPEGDLRRRGGLRNIENRARRHHGTVSWEANSPAGTMMHWHAPSPPSPESGSPL